MNAVAFRFRNLEEIKPSCMDLKKVGDEINFFILEHVSDDQLLTFVRELNQGLDNHIWLEMGEYTQDYHLVGNER